MIQINNVTSKDFNFIGVYKILNIKNNKFYIGSGLGKRGIYQRIRGHISGFKNNNSHCIKLLNSMKKDGIENFYVLILEKCSKENCRDREQYYIDLLNPEYNILKNVYGPVGRIVSKETRLKIGKAHKGKKISQEHRQKIKIANLGKVFSKESREKMSKARSGINNYLYGKHLTQEIKDKISNTLKGRKLSEDTKNKISVSNIGRKFSEETRQKIKNSNIGKKRSEKTKINISKAKLTKSKKIINENTNEIYDNIYLASEKLNNHFQSLRRILDGKRPNSKIKIKWLIESDKQKLI